jgi:rhamnose utilization protein RhaD (predicted bifunctional aldolase and dehydrogenase)
MSDEVTPVETIEAAPVPKTYTQEDIDKLKGALDKERELRKHASEPFKDRFVKAEVKAALAAAGTKKADRVLRILDLSKVAVDDDFNVSGIDEAIESAKEEFPELFDTKRQVSSIDAGDKGEPSKQLNTSEKQAAILLGRRA